MRGLLEIDAKVYASCPTRCFGLEARVAHFLTESEPAVRGANPRKILIRPAFEPVAFSYWDRFINWSLDDDAIAAMAGCLCGREVDYRTSTGASLPNDLGESALYPAPEIARSWRESMPMPVKGMSLLDSLSVALHALAAFVCLHPLSDGNGRVGRALFQGALARSLGLSCPMLALTPHTSLHSRAIARGLRRLGADGDWSDVVAAYHKVLEGSLEFHLQDARHFQFSNPSHKGESS